MATDKLPAIGGSSPGERPRDWPEIAMGSGRMNVGAPSLIETQDAKIAKLKAERDAARAELSGLKAEVDFLIESVNVNCEVATALTTDNERLRGLLERLGSCMAASLDTEKNPTVTHELFAELTEAVMQRVP